MLLEDLYRKPYYEQLNDIIKNMVDGVISDQEMLVQELKDWKTSDVRKNMLIGQAYYLEKTDIHKNKKQDIDWKSNLKLEHGFAKKLVNQKVGYLLSKEPTIATENKIYADHLKPIFSRKFLKTLKNTGKEAINKGIAYLYVYFDEVGSLAFKKIPSEQIVPFWKDVEHSEIMSFLRSYTESRYMNGKKETVEKVEYHHAGGINYFEFDGVKLIADNSQGLEMKYHFKIDDEPFRWGRIPLIPFKYNEEEQPLIDSIKSLIDNYNLQASTNADLLADIPKVIYKLVNYGGVDLAEFISDLNKYRTVKTDEHGDVGTIETNPATDANEKELERTRSNIYEFGRGLDSKDKDLGNASGKAMRHKYGDLDMDCNTLETEFQSSLEQLMWFVNKYLEVKDFGNFSEESIDIIFNRDIIISESEVITDAKNSIGILDDKTIRENHPWYSEDVEERLVKQKAEEQKLFEQQQRIVNPNPSEVIKDE